MDFDGASPIVISLTKELITLHDLPDDSHLRLACRRKVHLPPTGSANKSVPLKGLKPASHQAAGSRA